MKRISELLNQLESNIANSDTVNTDVSAASVGWHIEHCLLIFNGVIEATKNSNPADYKWKFNFTRLVVYTMNKFPRGKAQAPERVRPVGDIDIERLKKSIEMVRPRIEILNTLQPNNFFTHPYFGKLNLKNTVKFLEIHTNHHLKIINDILGK